MKVIVVGAVYSKYVHDICLGLKKHNVSVDELIIGTRLHRVLFKLNSVKRIALKHGYVEVIKRYSHKMEHSSPTHYSSLEDLKSEIGFKVTFFDYVNSGRVLAVLRQNTNQQVVVLAGSGIVDDAFLYCAGENCLNGHPAFLPGYRGVDVVDRALLDNEHVGVTAHFVSSKVDAGEILARESVQLVKGESYSDFRNRVNEEQAKVVVKAVDMILSGNKVSTINNDISNSKMCFAASVDEQKKAISNYYSMLDKL